MASFPEEPLDSPLGYYAAQPGQTLNNGEWTIVRKSGWGTRSSSWLAVDTEDPECYQVLKILTATATKDPATAAELELLLDGPLSFLSSGGMMPGLIDHFYEGGPKGRHLCMVLPPFGASVESLRLSGGDISGGSLPVHTVQSFVSSILEPLSKLDELDLIHGAVTSSNLLFSSPQSAPDIREALASNEPLASVEMLRGEDGEVYPVVISQPFDNGLRWNSSQEYIEYSSVYLSNFGHARKAPVTGTTVLDGPLNILPPEALQGDHRFVTTKANIWQLGCLIYFLLTGTSLFPSSYAESPIDTATEVLSTLEDLLKRNGKLHEDDIPPAASYIRSCLTINPNHRPNAFDLVGNDWVMLGRICSCVGCVDYEYPT